MSCRMLRAFLPPVLSLQLAIALAGVLSACKGDSPAGPAGPAVLASITITPDVTLTTNATHQFTAVGKDAAGAEVPISPIWSVVAGGGAVDHDGLFTAGAVAGTFTATVKAVSEGVSGTASVTVIVGTVVTITVSPDTVTLAIHGTQQFIAVGKDAAGAVVAIVPVWSVVAGGGGVDDTGGFIADTVPGSYPNTVRAAIGNISGSATVTVTAGALSSLTVSPDTATLLVNGVQQFTAVGKDANGNVLAITPTWSVVANGGNVSTAGLFTAGTQPGTFANTVRATSGTISGSATVAVIAGALSSITVSPDTATLLINGTRQFTAVAKDAAGNVLAITPTWSVVANGGNVSTAGLFTAGTQPGTFANTVRATSGTVSGTATVRVIVGPLATITVSPDTATLLINGTQQFTAVGRDAGGNLVALTPTWSMVTGGGAIDLDGLLTAGTVAGTYSSTVRAMSGGIHGSATLVVTDPPPLVDLAAAATYGVLGATTVTCVSGTTINGDVGVAPGPAVANFPPCTAGALHENDGPAQAAHASLVTAFGQLAAMPCGPVPVAELGGKTLQPGVHCALAAMALTTEVFLDAMGDPNASFVIKVATAALTTAAASRVTLQNGAQAKNIYWVIGSSATLGANSFMKGNMIAATTITFGAEVELVGRALARDGAVTLGTSDLVNLP